MIDVIVRENPSHKPFLGRSLEGLGEEELGELDDYLGYCASNGLDIEFLAESYNTIVMDTLREQIYFMRNKRYRHSTYAEVADTVYGDAVYMARYMYGLAITLFFWPAHRELKAFFDATLPVDKGGRYLEIGPGHGFYFIRAMTRSGYSEFTGVDISPKSVEMTRNTIESGYFGSYSNYSVVCKDFLSADFGDELFDALVMGEVLEHVEEPGDFLRQIRKLTRDDSYIYISTCMNAPAVDHLALFTSLSHLVSIIEEAGLRVREQCLIPYPGLTVEETEEKALAMNVGLVLGHS